jgi:aspartokinase/homoserine dehydrogenase 1
VQVHKFGGTCVAAAERISAAAKLILEEPAQQKLVVVSAMGSHPSSPVKVTDLLLNMVAKASKQDQAFLIDLAALQVRRIPTEFALLPMYRPLSLLSGLTARCSPARGTCNSRKGVQAVYIC